MDFEEYIHDSAESDVDSMSSGDVDRIREDDIDIAFVWKGGPSDASDWPIGRQGDFEPLTDEVKKLKKDHKNKERLSKRLMYLLRYGAQQEGLTVHPGGYVELPSLMKVKLMKQHSEEEVRDIITEAMTYRGTPRFEKKETSDVLYIRARFGQRMERNKYHEGTKVLSLLNTCLGHICKHISDYDFENFPDLFLLNAILHKLKRDKKLSNNAMRNILNTSIEHLDLEGIYLTNGTLKIVGNKCPNLQILSLRGCGYGLNDHFMEQFFRKVKTLRSLNISGCHHLTDRTLVALAKSNEHLVHLNASGNQNYSEKGLLNLILTCSKLGHLDVFDNQNVTEAGRKTMVEISKERKLTVILKGLTDESIAPEDPSMVLKIWKAGLI